MYSTFWWVISFLPCPAMWGRMSSDSHWWAVLILSFCDRLCAGWRACFCAGTRCGWCIPDKPSHKKALCHWMGFQCSSLISSLGNVSPLSSNCLYLNFWSEESSSFSNWTNRVLNRCFCLWQDVPHFLCKPSARSHLFNLFSVRKI